MHYLGFVLLNELTDDALAAAMAPHRDAHWDWYRPGGRWDGYLLGSEEQKRRATDRGFNYSPGNEQITLNFCEVKDLPQGKRPYFFVAGGQFVEKETWRDGHSEENKEFEKQFLEELAKYKYVVVVDAHN